MDVVQQYNDVARRIEHRLGDFSGTTLENGGLPALGR